MITTNTVEGRIEMRAFGRLTLADLKAFEAQSDALGAKRDLLLDLRNLGGTSLDALIEEWKYAHQHAQDFRRIAVISEDSFVGWGACLSQLFVDADIQLFDSEARANSWLTSPYVSPGEEPPADAAPQ
ncbi:STAS/SEC14 domain-containing protein [Uliginosibacterium gangwonense]|uniref:STAS/SEC14 domain-containing protein n=1 Tax=Uliginosibacterium gangwonense TaxID=392736 RepID=UPI0003730AFD|nr:STAS/SEC14 domain-containing protein [Uliginosibacterium gangwonense]